MCCQLFPRNTSGILIRLWLDEFSAALRSSRHILSQKRLNLNDTALHKGVCVCVWKRHHRKWIPSGMINWFISSPSIPRGKACMRGAWDFGTSLVWPVQSHRYGRPLSLLCWFVFGILWSLFFFFFFRSDGWCGLIWDWWEFGFLGVWNYLWPLLSVSWGLTDVQTVRILDDRFCCDTVKRTWYSWDIKLEGYTLRSISVYLFMEIVFKIVST